MIFEKYFKFNEHDQAVRKLEISSKYVNLGNQALFLLFEILDLLLFCQKIASKMIFKNGFVYWYVDWVTSYPLLISKAWSLSKDTQHYANEQSGKKFGAVTFTLW